MSTSLHIDDIGNLILRDGKFGLFVSSQYVAPPHYGGGRVGALCPYAYCAGDPVNLVDSTGMSTYHVGDSGMISVDVNSLPDTIDGKGQDGKQNNSLPLQDSQVAVLEEIIKQQGNESQKHNVTVSIKKEKMEEMDAKGLFAFLSENSHVEWAVSSLNRNEKINGSQKDSFLFATDHKYGNVDVRYNILGIDWTAHSHPEYDGTKGPSGKPCRSYDYLTAYNQFKEGKYEYQEQFPSHYVYHSYTKTWYQYTPWKSWEVNF